MKNRDIGSDVQLSNSIQYGMEVRQGHLPTCNQSIISNIYKNLENTWCSSPSATGHAVPGFRYEVYKSTNNAGLLWYYETGPRFGFHPAGYLFINKKETPQATNHFKKEIYITRSGEYIV